MNSKIWRDAIRPYQTKIRNLRILVCVLLLLGIYGLMGRWDRAAQESAATEFRIPAQQSFISNAARKGVL